MVYNYVALRPGGNEIWGVYTVVFLYACGKQNVLFTVWLQIYFSRHKSTHDNT